MRLVGLGLFTLVLSSRDGSRARYVPRPMREGPQDCVDACGYLDCEEKCHRDRSDCVRLSGTIQGSLPHTGLGGAHQSVGTRRPILGRTSVKSLTISSLSRGCIAGIQSVKGCARKIWCR
jgi:hypothetical protein